MNNPCVLLIIAALIWAGSVIAGKLAVAKISPMPLIMMGWVLVLLVTLPFDYKSVKRNG